MNISIDINRNVDIDTNIHVNKEMNININNPHCSIPYNIRGLEPPQKRFSGIDLVKKICYKIIPLTHV